MLDPAYASFRMSLTTRNSSRCREIVFVETLWRRATRQAREPLSRLALTGAGTSIATKRSAENR